VRGLFKGLEGLAVKLLVLLGGDLGGSAHPDWLHLVLNLVHLV
jgi:hypothetical protein